MLDILFLSDMLFTLLQHLSMCRNPLLRVSRKKEFEMYFYAEVD